MVTFLPPLDIVTLSMPLLLSVSFAIFFLSYLPLLPLLEKTGGAYPPIAKMRHEFAALGAFTHAPVRKLFSLLLGLGNLTFTRGLEKISV